MSDLRIVHSFWSLPFLKSDDINSWDRSSGGWLDRRYNYYSWALSCLTFNKFYKNIILYSDSYGKDLLVDKLGLPYTEVKVVFDELHYHPDLWAIGKLYAYQFEKQPFLHVDGDVYIWKKFGNSIEHGDLVIQNLEDNFSYYKDIFLEIEKNLEYIPNDVIGYSKKGSDFSGINAGVFGGNDVEFIHYYVSEALEFVNKNKTNLNKINIGLFNNFYEQCLFRILTEKKKKKITTLLTSVNDRFDGLCDLTGVPNNSWYAHAVGVYKKRKETNELVEFRLRSEFPDCYYKINELIKACTL